MAIFTAFQPAILPEQQVFFGLLTEETATRITITGLTQTVTYIGNFLYPLGGGVTGTVTNMEGTLNGSPFFEASNINVDAAALFDAIQIQGSFELATSIIAGGNDILNGSSGGDEFSGLDGNDRLLGRGGDDTIFGNNGADFLDGGGGSDTMFGGLGNDFYVVDRATDVVSGEIAFSQGGGIDTVRSFVNYVQPTNIELVRLGVIDGTANLNATGNDAPGTLVGNAGSNILIGRGGNDQLNGNGGNDFITGNTGRDTLVGGGGADTFIYTAYADSRAGSVNRDVINGFDRGADKIDLSQIDAITRSNLIDDAFDFIGTARFSGTAGELRLQGLGGPNAILIEADHNGDRVADLQIFVNVIRDLGAEDFIL